MRLAKALPCSPSRRAIVFRTWRTAGFGVASAQQSSRYSAWLSPSEMRFSRSRYDGFSDIVPPVPRGLMVERLYSFRRAVARRPVGRVAGVGAAGPSMAESPDERHARRPRDRP